MESEDKVFQTLLGLGLQEKEVFVYLACLKLGESNIATIAREAGIKRPTAYLILDSLYEQGYIAKREDEKRTFFRARTPSIFQKRLEEKQRSLQSILPDLFQMGRQRSGAPGISTHVGAEGLIEIMDITLATEGDVCGWFRPDMDDVLLDKIYVPTYKDRRIARGKTLRGIVPAKLNLPEEYLLSASEKREVYPLAEDLYPLKDDVFVLDNKVAVISYADSVGFVLESDCMTAALRMLFEASFKFAKQNYIERLGVK